MKPELIKMIAMTFEVCGSTEVSEGAQKIIATSLSEYPPFAIQAALERCCREVKGRLALADIIQRIDDGRPGVEEAWAIVDRARKDANSTIVWTTEMAEAFGVVEHMDDDIAARMSFKEAYKRSCEEAKLERIPVKWMPSLGDYNGRSGPLLDAVRLGRLEASHVRNLVPELPPMDEEMPFLPPPTKPATEGRQLPYEDVSELCQGVIGKIELKQVEGKGNPNDRFLHNGSGWVSWVGNSFLLYSQEIRAERGNDQSSGAGNHRTRKEARRHAG